MSDQPRSRLKMTTLRMLVGALVGLTLVSGLASSILAQHAASASADKGVQKPHGGVVKGATRSGVVNLATLPPATPAMLKAAASATPARFAPRTPAQAAAAQQWLSAHPGALPKATGKPAPTRTNTYGNGALPVLISKGAGINSATGGSNVPFPTVAAAPGYVMEAAQGKLVVYNTSYGVKYGPWTPNQLFASVMYPGDTSFGPPQVVYDAERSVYIIAWIEYRYDVIDADFLDIAISKSSTPSPLTNFYVYRIDPQVLSYSAVINCNNELLGYDYWGAYVTCQIYDVTEAPVFMGNATFAFNINNMRSGSLGMWDYWQNITTDINCDTGCVVASELAPAIEDGVPQAEWIIGTDQGIGGSIYQNLTLCALTNTHAIGSSTSPTLTCDLNMLPLAYDNPRPAAEPGGVTLGNSGWLGYLSPIAYRNGQLYFALPLILGCSGNLHDGVMWAAVDPQLTTKAAHSPQWVNGLNSAYTNSGYFCFTNADLYTPTLIAGTEGDMTLTFGASSGAIYPSVYYTGRAAADASGDMGQGGASAPVVLGSNTSTSGVWSPNAGCALTTNLVTRGVVYCVTEYAGPSASSGSGWDTELYAIRME
jgi:hypothetical protein